jgi:hypothetical protein
MAETIWSLPPEKDSKEARRHFLDIYGAATVTVAWQRVAIVGLIGLCFVLLGLLARSQKAAATPERIVVGVYASGRTVILPRNALDYQPHEAELKYFLTDFVQRHYGRMRATFRDNYARSLYFLDGHLAESLMYENQKTDGLKKFRAGEGDESDIAVKNVSLDDLRTAPYRATVEFERVTYGSGNHGVVRHDNYVANFIFDIRSTIPNAQIPINPLGLTITYFRADQAFGDTRDR